MPRAGASVDGSAAATRAVDRGGKPFGEVFAAWLRGDWGMSPTTAGLPGFWRFVWLFWMQPIAA